MNKVSCKIILDTKSKEPEKRLFLSVTYQRQAYKYSMGLNYKLTKEQFENKNLKITKEALAEAEPEKLRAEQIIKQLGDDFSFSRFKALFRGETEENNVYMSDYLLDVFEHYLKDHPKLTPGSIDSYKTIVNHLITYNKKVKVSDLTVDYIRSFLAELKKSNNIKSEATINIYLRSLRAIYNYAQRKLNLDPKNYPFGQYKIEISSNTNIKKALNEKEFRKLVSFKPKDKSESFALDLFLISFGLAGMNIADIISIKNKEINKDHVLTYYRKKTRNRQKNVTPISIKIGKPTFELISKYGLYNPDAPDDFVFPFLRIGMNQKQELRKRKDITKRINKSLKDICEHIGIEKITTYSARHTIATMLMNSGTPLLAISKSLGHSSFKVTQDYLDSLSDKVINDISDKTTSFMTITTDTVDADDFSK